jgi:hypothetical protein
MKFLIGCRCRGCRRGLRSAGMKAWFRKATKSVRRECRSRLNRGKIEMPLPISVPYVF